MAVNWQLGVPPVLGALSEDVEVTDGDLVISARYRPARLIEPGEMVPDAWLDAEGREIDWQPTHWRRLPAKMLAPNASDLSPATFELE